MSPLTLTRRAPVPAPRATLALFPSLGTSTRVWNPILSRLRSRGELRVLLFDLPGHGFAEPAEGFDFADLVRAAADQLAHESVHGPLIVAGVSLGGAIAVELARRNPAEIAAFASFSSAVSFGSSAGWQEIIDRVRESSTPAFDIAATRLGWFTEDYASGADHVVVDALLAELAATDPESYIACCRALESYDGTLGPSITVPGIAVAAAEDRATPASEMRALAELGDEISYEEIPGAHLAIVEHAALAALMIDELVDSVLARDPAGDASGRAHPHPHRSLSSTWRLNDDRSAR